VQKREDERKEQLEMEKKREEEAYQYSPLLTIVVYLSPPFPSSPPLPILIFFLLPSPSPLYSSSLLPSTFLPLPSPFPLFFRRPSLFPFSISITSLLHSREYLAEVRGHEEEEQRALASNQIANAQTQAEMLSLASTVHDKIATLGDFMSYFDRRKFENVEEVRLF